MKLRAFVVVVIVLLAGLTMKDARASRSESGFRSEKDKLSYALGMTFATQLRKQSIDVDAVALGQGLRDALSNQHTRLTEQQARGIIATLQRGLKTKQLALQREQGRQHQDAAARQAPQTFTFLFKLDPRLMSGVYGGGDRWVSPPTYTKVGEGKTCTVDVKVFDPTLQAGPGVKWTADDPRMVTITPAEGREVKIVVQHAGETRVQVTAGGISRTLTVKGTYKNDVLQADISQPRP